MKPITFLGKLYLIPTTLGESTPEDVLPQTVKRAIDFIMDYVVENEKTARKFIKSIHPEKVQADLRLHVLNKHTQVAEHNDMLKPCLEGRNVGLMSEAGCPGVADPAAAASRDPLRHRDRAHRDSGDGRPLAHAGRRWQPAAGG